MNAASGRSREATRTIQRTRTTTQHINNATIIQLNMYNNVCELWVQLQAAWPTAATARVWREVRGSPRIGVVINNWFDIVLLLILTRICIIIYLLSLLVLLLLLVVVVFIYIYIYIYICICISNPHARPPGQLQRRAGGVGRDARDPAAAGLRKGG